MLLLKFVFLLAVQLLDLDMSSEEKKKTGVHKLSIKQKAELQQWIDAHYEKRSAPLAQRKAPVSPPTLSENLHSGRYIRLSDNTLWEIRPEDAPIAQGWITPVEILISSSNDTDYPYKLTNSVTKSSLRAKKIDAIPPEAK